MIWEQDISVIVMLTRLNENSAKMCHCYWPTNVAGAANDQLEPASDANGAHCKSASGHTPEATPTTANGRRGSVTSVFNALGAARLAGAQPIIANGDLGDNVLSFEVNRDASFDDQVDGAASPVTASAKAAKIGAAKSTPKLITTRIRFEVQLVSEHVSSSDYLVRNMYLINRNTGETRTITQFHYLAWPKNGVPENVKSLLQFRRKVHKSYRNLKSPILVHSSDGAGRSGTYCLIDIMLERIKNGAKEIDPRATLEHLRDQRIGLCATLSQFEFVLVALAEEIQTILDALPR